MLTVDTDTNDTHAVRAPFKFFTIDRIWANCDVVFFLFFFFQEYIHTMLCTN